jgi:iron(III) transport system ATP-binding protein
MNALQVDQLSAGFVRGEDVLSGLSFSLKPGTIGCLLGPSGCGKTTALRAIAGFFRPRQGEIAISGQCVLSATQWLAPEERGVGVVFQDYALFPHLSIGRNVAFGLRDMAPVDAAQRVQEMLTLVGLEAAAQRYPHELSGGQQQRVALARALAPAPKLLLLDEPFSNLDPDMRERLAQEVRAILKQSGTTSLMVTHDQYEAFALADEVGVMRNGRIEQWDNAYNLYHRPATAAVADFVGMGVFMPARLERRQENGVQRATVHIELGQFELEDGPDAQQAMLVANERNELTVLLRPDDVIHDDASLIQAEVLRKAFRGAQFLYTLRLPSGSELLALVPSHHNHAIGERIGIRFEAEHVITFSR